MKYRLATIKSKDEHISPRSDLDWFSVPCCSPCRWYFAMISMSGAFSVTFSVIFAYVADVTDERERSTAYGLVSTAAHFGFLNTAQPKFVCFDVYMFLVSPPAFLSLCLAPPHKVSATFAASLVTSPAIGAYLSAWYGDNLVVLLATLISLADIGFILLAVPESLPDKMKLNTWGAPISWEQADPFTVSTPSCCHVNHVAAFAL